MSDNRAKSRITASPGLRICALARAGSFWPMNNLCGSVPAHLDVNHNVHRQCWVNPIAKGDLYWFSVAHFVQGPVAGSYPCAAEKYRATFSPSSQSTLPCSLHLVGISSWPRVVSTYNRKSLNFRNRSPHSVIAVHWDFFFSSGSKAFLI